VIPSLGNTISALVSATLAYRASHLFTSRVPKWTFFAVIGAVLSASVAGAFLVLYNSILVSTAVRLGVCKSIC
jgi:hypothetical protein